MTASDQLKAYCQRNTHDPASLTVLMTFAWSLPSRTAYTNDDTFSFWRRIVEYIILQNLRLRFELNAQQVKSKWVEFVNLLLGFPSNFLEHDTYTDDKALVQSTANSVLVEELRVSSRDWASQPSHLFETDRRVVGLLLSFVPVFENRGAVPARIISH